MYAQLPTSWFEGQMLTLLPWMFEVPDKAICVPVVDEPFCVIHLCTSVLEAQHRNFISETIFLFGICDCLYFEESLVFNL